MHAKRMDWLHALAVQEPTGECVDWPWARKPSGYPVQMFLAGRRQTAVAHVLMSLLGHERPSQLHGVLHSCDRPACVAPWHLRWGTTQDNTNDMIRRGRAAVSVLDQEKAQQIRTAVSSGSSQRSQAREYGVHHSVIQQIIRHEIWREPQHAS
jgi:hypothetical protein